MAGGGGGGGAVKNVYERSGSSGRGLPLKRLRVAIASPGGGGGQKCWLIFAERTN